MRKRWTPAPRMRYAEHRHLPSFTLNATTRNGERTLHVEKKKEIKTHHTTKKNIKCPSSSSSPSYIFIVFLVPFQPLLFLSFFLPLPPSICLPSVFFFFWISFSFVLFFPLCRRFAFSEGEKKKKRATEEKYFFQFSL